MNFMSGQIKIIPVELRDHAKTYSIRASGIEQLLQRLSPL